jgi:hypothetical protein
MQGLSVAAFSQVQFDHFYRELESRVKAMEDDDIAAQQVTLRCPNLRF